jgi:nitrite reductase/ring-hydroxylating ferredoxin subunit
VSDFVKVAEAGDLEPGESLQTEIGDTSVALFNVEGCFHALAGRCPHRGGPLGDGYVDGREVMCPLHAWTFDVTTGQNIHNPDMKQPSFETRVEDGSVFVKV